MSIQPECLKKMLEKGIGAFFPEKKMKRIMDRAYKNALDRFEFCISKIKLPHFRKKNESFFNHLHGDHLAMFLWFLGNATYHLGDTIYATRLSHLNKTFHGIDLFHFVEMPEVFLLVHPVGTVLGRAQYRNYFVAYQNCTVGSEISGIYPKFEKKVILFSRSSVLGNCNVGTNVCFGANSFICNQNIKNNSIVLGQNPKNRIIKNDQEKINHFFET